MVKVVDLFAGPGGLSEGFSVFSGKARKKHFDIVLSIEKEKHAFETLKLRTFLRQFTDRAPKDYYDFLTGRIDLESLYNAHPEELCKAEEKCWQKEIGEDEDSVVDVRQHIRASLKGDELDVLVGGPPCQAYSLAGRSRNAGNPNYIPEEDKRQRLYIEYLQVLADQRPAVFIMENVKGLLSATLSKHNIFIRMVDDLRDPNTALRRENRNTSRGGNPQYRIYSLVDGQALQDGNIASAVVRAENFGIPQSRHRVILLGLRDDIEVYDPPKLIKRSKVAIKKVISDLPKIRSGLTEEEDSDINWRNALRSQLKSEWVKGKPGILDQAEFSKFMTDLLSRIISPRHGKGSEYIEWDRSPEYEPDWYTDQRMKGIINHTSRSHMTSDLWRYFYAACYAKFNKASPTLANLPHELLPKHANVQKAIESGSNFSDRFRVQLSEKPATTIVSHIGKDGHYYIHPDPLQCRSLTVREAARIQTFPDNYFFTGDRTAQYIQVGNAVPPLLAYQIAGVVNDIFLRIDGTGA